jgi:hypothetical protein
MGGKMKARAVAEKPPVTSSTNPRLHVKSAMMREVPTRPVVIIIWRFIEKDSPGKKYVSMT